MDCSRKGFWPYRRTRSFSVRWLRHILHEEAIPCEFLGQGEDSRATLLRAGKGFGAG